jgi:hypothetical protein
MQHFVGDLMHKRRELLGWLHPGKQCDLAAIRETFCGSNSLGETNLDTLRFHELKQTFAVSAHVAIDFGQCWEFFAFGLADIENVDGPESVQRPLTLRGCVFTRLVGRYILRASSSDHRGENENAFFSPFIFQFIAQACQSLAATAAPSITAMGIHIVIALATIMLVWFGVQEALASAHGGPGFSMGRFLNLFMLLTFAYVMVNYYDSSIPGLGFSIKGFIDGGTINLVNLIGSDGSNTMLNEIHTASSKTGPSMLNSHDVPYYAIVYFAVQFLLALLAAIVSAILAYGAIAATIIGLLGPIFIPFLVFDKLDWLFWGWLKAYLGFSFYKVVAAATMNVLSHVLTNYYIQLGQSVSDPSTMVQTLPLLVLLVLVNIYILFKIPTMTHSLFTAVLADTVEVWAWPMMAIRAAM